MFQATTSKQGVLHEVALFKVKKKNPSKTAIGVL